MGHEELHLRTYNLWDLYLHVNQHPYVGRAYAWIKRQGTVQATEMSPDEREELFDRVLKDWWHAMTELFRPDLMNIAAFGNRTPHLHWHLIPRYRSPNLCMASSLLILGLMETMLPMIKEN